MTTTLGNNRKVWKTDDAWISGKDCAAGWVSDAVDLRGSRRAVFDVQFPSGAVGTLRFQRAATNTPANFRDLTLDDGKVYTEQDGAGGGNVTFAGPAEEIVISSGGAKVQVSFDGPSGFVRASWVAGAGTGLANGQFTVE